MLEKFMKDPQANTVAVIVLIALIISWLMSLILNLGDKPIQKKGWYTWLLPVFSLLGIPAALDLLQTTGITFVFAIIVSIVILLNIIVPILHVTGKSPHPLVTDWYKWSIPLIVAAGVVVAGYLSFVETTDAAVMCGPVGNCGDVQNSKYAILFDILPVGILGLAGYVAILAAWLVDNFGPHSLKKWSALGIWGMSMFGVMFSIYLTYLEPFVIGATCMWCITSAVLMILTLLISTPAAQQALAISND